VFVQSVEGEFSVSLLDLRRRVEENKELTRLLGFGGFTRNGKAKTPREPKPKPCYECEGKVSSSFVSSTFSDAC